MSVVRQVLNARKEVGSYLGLSCHLQSVFLLYYVRSFWLPYFSHILMSKESLMRVDYSVEYYDNGHSGQRGTTFC